MRVDQVKHVAEPSLPEEELATLAVLKRQQSGEAPLDCLQAIAEVQLRAALVLAGDHPDEAATDLLQRIFLSNDCAALVFGHFDLAPNRESDAYWDSAAGLARLAISEAQKASPAPPQAVLQDALNRIR